MRNAFKAACYRCQLALMLLALPAIALAVQPAVDMEGATPRKDAVFAIPDVPPWGYASKTGEPAGVLVAITDRMADLADVPIKYRLRPQKRALAELKSGAADFVVLFESPESEAAGKRIATLLESRVVLTTRPAQDFKNLEDLAGGSVGFVLGTYYGKAFDDTDNIKKIPVHNLQNGLEMLDRGRIDALIHYDVMLERVIYANDYDASDFRSHVLSDGREGLLLISRRSPLKDYVPLFQKALRQMRANGEIVELVRSAP